MAVANRAIDFSRLLIEKGADLNAKTDATPLHLACRSGRNEIVALLLESGAEVDARTESGRTPLHVAASKNSLDVARLLIKHGAHTDVIDLSCMGDQEDG